MKLEIQAPDFKKIFENAPSMYLVLLPDSPRFTIVAVSEAYLKVTRLTRDQMVGRSLLEVFPMDDLKKSLDQAMSTRLPTKMTNTNPFGSSTTTPIFGEDGQILNLVYNLDVAHPEGSKDRMIFLENERILLDSITDLAIYLLDSSGRILSCNAGAEKINGYSSSDLIGKSFSTLYSMEEVKEGKPIRDLGSAQAQGKFADVVHRLRKDGTEFWSNVVISARYDQTGKTIGFVKVVRDISRQKEDALALVDARGMLEARVLKRTQDLLRSNTELEQFAYIASHDLQTPLRHVSSYVQLLTNRIKKTHTLDDKTEKWIEYILKGTQQMKSLISDLLSYSRIGRVDIKIEEIDTAEVFAHIMDDLQESVRATNAKLVYNKLPPIFGIKSQIEQLFLNLIENAIKFRTADIAPVVTISCEDDGEFWRFSVSDNGIGIDPKYSERIFLMFHRLHSQDQYSGTGIGLAICKKIVEFHDGKIWLTAIENKGAIFTFTLPKKERVTSTNLVKDNQLPA